MKRYKIIDPNYKIKAYLYLDHIQEYENNLGQLKKWYMLKRKVKDDICYYFAENQIEEVNVKNNRF